MKEKYRLSSKFGMINCKSLRGTSLTHEALFFKSLIFYMLNLYNYNYYFLQLFDI